MANLAFGEFCYPKSPRGTVVIKPPLTTFTPQPIYRKAHSLIATNSQCAVNILSVKDSSHLNKMIQGETLSAFGEKPVRANLSRRTYTIDVVFYDQGDYLNPPSQIQRLVTVSPKKEERGKTLYKVLMFEPPAASPC